MSEGIDDGVLVEEAYPTPVEEKKSEDLDSDGNLKDNYKTNIKYGSEGIKTHNTIKRLQEDLGGEPEPPGEDIRFEDEKNELKLKEEKLKEAEHEIHRLKRDKGNLVERRPKEKERNEKLEKLKEHISNKLKKFEKRRTELRENIEKSSNSIQKKKDEEE